MDDSSPNEYDRSGKRLGVQHVTADDAQSSSSSSTTQRYSLAYQKASFTSSSSRHRSGGGNNDATSIATEVVHPHHSLPSHPDKIDSLMHGSSEAQRKKRAMRRKLNKMKRAVMDGDGIMRRSSAVSVTGGMSVGGSSDDNDAQSVYSAYSTLSRGSSVSGSMRAPRERPRALGGRRMMNKSKSERPGGGFYYPGTSTVSIPVDKHGASTGSFADVEGGGMTEGHSVPPPPPVIPMSSSSSVVSYNRRGNSRSILGKIGGAKSHRNLSMPPDPSRDIVEADYQPEKIAMLKDLIENEDAMIDEERTTLTQEAKKHQTRASLITEASFAEKYLFNSDDEDDDFFPDPRAEELKKLRRIASNGMAMCAMIVFMASTMVLVGLWEPLGFMKPDYKPTNFNANTDPIPKEELIQMLLPMSPHVNVVDSPPNKALQWLLQQKVILGKYHVKDLFILGTLYYATKGTEWNNVEEDSNNWLTDLNHCQWLGVLCKNSEGETVALDLDEFGLKGTIPHELGQLEHLEKLHLPNNFISGTMPSTLFNLRNVKSLKLQHNLIHGPIPKGIGAMTKLQHLDLSQNNINGHIPNGLGNLKYLTNLHLSENQLKGEIPLELANMKQLEWLGISENNIDGPLPSQLWHMESLKGIDASSNRLSGTIPPVSPGELPNLHYLNLGHNSLSGSLANRLGVVTSLTTVNLAFNKFSGIFPDLRDAKELEKLYVEGNNFQSDPPRWLAQLTSLQVLRMERNDFQGEIDEAVCQIHIADLVSDCGGDDPWVSCKCCTKCVEHEGKK